MKQVLKYSWIIGLAFLLQACESSMPIFTESECEIRFASASETMKKTFVYDKPGTKTDTVKVIVQAVGFVKDYDRPFVVRQADAEKLENAILGAHFQTFDEQQFFMPAGQSTIDIPIIIINDASLKNKQFVLRLELGSNEHFRANMEKDLCKNIEITNLLTMPSNWRERNFGTYGRVKHQFLIDISGKKWDELFYLSLLNNSSLLAFWQERAKRELKAENERLAARGEGPLREDPLPGEEKGILVTF